MSRSLDDLTLEMKNKAVNVKKYCNLRGVDLLIYYTKRTLKEQAILFRQSYKDYQIIKNKIVKLENMGFDFLAKILKDVGPQIYTGWVTNAGPGESWHNFSEAFDAVPCEGKDCLWSYEGNEKEWDIYRDAVKSEGLTWGGDFPDKIKDRPHAQLRSYGNPLRLYTPEEIKKMLRL